MAKNWKAAEAVKAIKSGDKVAIIDLGRRYPLFANLAAQCNEAGVKILECAPDYLTARKIESGLKGDIDDTEVEDDSESVEDDAAEVKEEAKATAGKEKKAATKKAEKAKETSNDEVIEGKSAKELFNMCVAAGLKVKPKQDKAVYLEALKKAADKAEEKADDDDWDEDEEEEKPAKKPAKKAEAKAKASSDDDDWDI